MKKLNILKTAFIIAFSFLALQTQAQYKIKQVLVANGGVFFGPGNMITIGAFDPIAHKYTLFDSVSGNSVTQVLTSQNVAFMATDSYLVKYDIDNHTRLKMVLAKGLRYMALYKTYIAATIGNGGNGVHFRLYNQSDLSMVYEETNIPAFCEGIAIAGDSAYLAIQGSYPNYNDTGKIAVEDLVNHKLHKIITLDTASRGIGQLFFNGSSVVGVTEYPYGVINDINIKTGVKTALVSSVYQPFTVIKDSVYGSVSGGVGFEDLADMKTTSLVKTKSFGYAGAAIDTINKFFIYTGASFSKPTSAYVTTYKGMIIDSFPVGISPQGVAIDYRHNTGIDENNNQTNFISFYPNPANSTLNINGLNGNIHRIAISDMQGRELYSIVPAAASAISMPVSQLNTGLYLLNIYTSNGLIVEKFIKN